MVRAKFQCESVTKHAWGSEQVKLHAVCAAPGEKLNEEDASFSKATPNGNLEMHIDNPGVQGFFKPGQSYYLDFSEAPKA